ncbi:MAG: hypothetical protein O7I93_04465 [Gemmatimonadetes bacterium]|nr:hypothetical protein [Gemmatimonadota bacterium]
MTHTLHRHGRYEDLASDFIVTAMPARGFNDRDALPKLKQFLRTALKYRPVNLGNSIKGAQHRSSRALSPMVHWRRDSAADPQSVIAEVDRPTTVSAVFDNAEAVQRLVAELVELDLGLSVNIASVPDKAVECCDGAGLVRHSVEYSLGFRGQTERLPDDATLQLTTMCGHGMIASGFARKMTDWVRSGRRTPEEASRYLARFCVCGSFNPARARRIFEQAAKGE